MSKIDLKYALILSLLVVSFSVSAEKNKEFLANRCNELAQTVTALVSSQRNHTCVNKLYLASQQMNSAAEFILGDSTLRAKEIMDNAIASLQFAELAICNHFIQISHTRHEVSKLKHLL